MKNPYEDMKTMTNGELCRGLGLQATLFVGIGMALWWVSGREISSFVTVSLYEIGLGFAMGLGLIALAFVIFAGLPELSEKLVRMQAKNFAFLERKVPMPMIVFMSICAGVGEEALFRAGLQTWLGDYTHISIAIVLSAAAFTVIHFARAPIAAMIFVIGALFGVAYWWTESLLAMMIGHAVYDVFAFWYLQRELHRLDAFETFDADLDEEPASG